ncbi:SCP2 sterol-binding domain-containing protein, partial [Escherichia albertii]|nr:SCP2 sterol-binding domain-containing protein [Escherichia albertii]
TSVQVAKFSVPLHFGENGGTYRVELENGVLNHSANAEASNADATIALSRDVLNKIVLKEETLKEAMEKGEVKITGNADKLNELLGYMDNFEFWFNIVTP